MALCCAKTQPCFVCKPVELRQPFSLHLKLHLRVLLEHLRIALPQQLRDPLVRNASTDPRGVSRTKIIDAKGSNTCPSQRSVPDRLETLLMTVWILVTREQGPEIASVVRHSDATL